MQDFTSFKVGGKSDLLVIPSSEDELKIILRQLSQDKVPFIVMGRGTNILIRDGGYRGAIIRFEEAFSEIHVEGTQLTAGAGASLSVVARAAMEHGLTGIEFASGIPGSLGGGTFMNAGAYNGEIKDIVREVRVLSEDGVQSRVVTNEMMAYGYRFAA